MRFDWYRLLWLFDVTLFFTALGSLDQSKFGNIAIEIKFPAGLMAGVITTILAHNMVDDYRTRKKEEEKE